MTRYKKIVFKVPEGMSYITTEGENGELIFELVCEEPEEAAGVANKGKYFTKITKQDREAVKSWLYVQLLAENYQDKEERFLNVVEQAIQTIDYDYWIATMEPCVQDKKIFYAENQKVGIGFSCKAWAQMAEEYEPESGSRLATLYELFLWYALRIVKGLWTFDGVTVDSTEYGNYSSNSVRMFEKTGARESGGYRDGQGNTYKIVTYDNDSILVGGCFEVTGKVYPIADAGYARNALTIQKNGSGVVVLTK